MMEPRLQAPVHPASPDCASGRRVTDIFLAPGGFFFGDRDTRIRTVLGSCVAVTLWHPLRLIGGMCHYILPTRGLAHGNGPDGRYGDEAFRMFLDRIERDGAQPGEFEAKLFGGGNMFPGERRQQALDVGRRNIELGLHLLKRHGFQVKAGHMAGVGHRNVVFEIWSGDVWIKHVEAGMEQ